MGGGSDGLPSLIVGGGAGGMLGGARLANGTLCIALSGPGVRALPLVARGMRRISPVRGPPCLDAMSGGAPGSGGGFGLCSARDAPLPPALTPPLVQTYVVSQASLNVDLPPVGPVTLVQRLRNCATLVSGARGKRQRAARMAQQAHAVGVLQNEGGVRLQLPSSRQLALPPVCTHREARHGASRPRVHARQRAHTVGAGAAGWRRAPPPRLGGSYLANSAALVAACKLVAGVP